MMEGENIEGLQIEVRRKDGSLVQLEVNRSTIRRNGRVVGMQGIIIDITERRKMEEALRESEEKFSRISQSMTDAVAITRLKEESTLKLTKRS
jgi:PAS domain-containing protein